MPPNALSVQNAELIALATGVCPHALLENRLVCADGITEYRRYAWIILGDTASSMGMGVA